MILTCPNCTSRFLLSAQALAPEGRRVKCSSCEEEWFQQPDPDELEDNEEHEIEEIPEAVKPIPEGSSVPALPDDEAQNKRQRNANLAGYGGALLVFLILFGGLVVAKDTLVNKWPPSAALYEIIGVSVTAPGEGLVFDQVKATFTGPNTIIVEGLIINLTNKTLSLPSIDVAIRNEAGDVVQHDLSHPPHDEMQPETTLPFKSVYQVAPMEADHVQIRFVYADKPESEHKADVSHEDEEEASHKEPQHEEAHDESPHHEEPKSASTDVDNTQALHVDDHADPHAAAAH